MLDGSMIVRIAVPGETTSPRLAGRSLTMPANGARIGVSSICCHAAFCRALRGRELRFGDGDGVLRLLEVARGERAAFDERRVRCCFALRARRSADSADLHRGLRRLERVVEIARRRSRAMTAPAATGWPRSTVSVDRASRRPARGRWLHAPASAGRRSPGRTTARRPPPWRRSPAPAETDAVAGVLAATGVSLPLQAAETASASAATLDRRTRTERDMTIHLAPNGRFGQQRQPARAQPERRAPPTRDWPAPAAAPAGSPDSSSCVEIPSRLRSSAI